MQRYFLKDFDVAFIKLHGFCDVSESADAVVGHIQAMDVHSSIIHTALMIAKTKVDPIKHLSIPRLK